MGIGGIPLPRMLRQHHPNPPGNPKAGLWVWWWELGLGEGTPDQGGTPRLWKGGEGPPNPRSLAEYGCLWSLARGSWGRMRGRGVLGVGSQGGRVPGDVEGMGDGFMPRAFM